MFELDHNDYFIGDTHLGHTNILKYESVARPFESIEAHDDFLIKAWNATVTPDNRVFHVGDVALNKHGLDKASLLYGRKTLIKGNHDKFSRARLLKIFVSVTDKPLICRYKSWKIALYHYPDLPPDYECDILIHGHSHSRQPASYRHGSRRYHCFNVSAEQNLLRPINIVPLMRRLQYDYS